MSSIRALYLPVCLVLGLCAPALAQDSTDLANVLDPGEFSTAPPGNFSSYAVEGAIDEAAVITGTDSDDGSFQMSVVPAGDESWWAPAAGGAALFGTAALRALPKVVEATPKSPSPAALVLGAVAVVGALSQEQEPELDPDTEERREERRFEFAMGFELGTDEPFQPGRGYPSKRDLGVPEPYRGPVSVPERYPLTSPGYPGKPLPQPAVVPDPYWNDPEGPGFIELVEASESDCTVGLWLVSCGYRYGDYLTGISAGSAGDTLTPQVGDDPDGLVFYASGDGTEPVATPAEAEEGADQTEKLVESVDDAEDLREIATGASSTARKLNAEFRRLEGTDPVTAEQYRAAAARFAAIASQAESKAGPVDPRRTAGPVVVKGIDESFLGRVHRTRAGIEDETDAGTLEMAAAYLEAEAASKEAQARTLEGESAAQFARANELKADADAIRREVEIARRGPLTGPQRYELEDQERTADELDAKVRSLRDSARYRDVLLREADEIRGLAIAAEKKADRLRSATLLPPAAIGLVEGTVATP